LETHPHDKNPVESVFATVRNWTRKTKGCFSRKTALSVVLKLRMPAQKSWRKLSGTNRLPEVILDWLLQEFDERGATAVIPPKTDSKLQLNYDAKRYK
jgi:hypothetical protein